MESVVQQRDMYRKLVQEAGLNASQSSPAKFRSDFVTSTPAAPSSSKPTGESGRSGVSQLEKLLGDANDRLRQVEEKHSLAVGEHKEAEKLLREKAEQLHDQLAEMRSQNTRLSTQMEYMEQKEKLLQGNLQSFKNQVDSLEQKNTLYACTVAKHEQSIAVLRDEAMNAQQQLARCQVTVAMLNEEKQLLKDAESRLLMERDSLVSERHSQGLLHSNLESIKLNLERAECETKMRLSNSVASLEHQCELLRKKLDKEEERYRETVKCFEDRLQAEKAALKQAEERAALSQLALEKMQQDVLVAAESRSARMTSPVRKNQVSRLLSTSASPSAPASAAGAPPPPIPTDTTSEQVNLLRTQLVESKTELESVREQLDLVRQQGDQYRAIAESMEEELKKSSEAAKSFQQEMEHRLGGLTAERDMFANDLQQAKAKLHKMEEGAAVLGRATAHQSEEVVQKIERLEAELLTAGDRLRLAEESTEQARRECLEAVKVSADAQDKYERELVQHAAAVEQLTVVKHALEERRAEKNATEQTLARCREELETGKSSWLLQKAQLESQSSQLAARCAELDKQVDLTQQQIVTMSTRMAAVTRVQEMSVK